MIENPIFNYESSFIIIDTFNENKEFTRIQPSSARMNKNGQFSQI